MHILDKARDEEDEKGVGVGEVTMGTETAEEEDMDHAERLWTSIGAFLLMLVLCKWVATAMSEAMSDVG